MLSFVLLPDLILTIGLLSSPSSNSQFQVTNPAVTGFRLSGEGREDLKISADGWLYLDKSLDWSKEDHYILVVKWGLFPYKNLTDASQRLHMT